MLGVLSILWSLTTVLAGYVDSFEAFAIMRVLLGILESANNPLAYSLIRDYFPPELRSTANSIFTSSIYVGGAFSSLSILLIEKFGWRGDYEITGGIGIIAGVIGLIALEEPIRGQFESRPAVIEAEVVPV